MIQEGGEGKAYKVKKLRWRQAGFVGGRKAGVKRRVGREVAENAAGCQQNGAASEILTALDQQAMGDCSRTGKGEL